MSATTDKKMDFWETLTGNKLLLTLTVTYLITGVTLYYFDLLPWSHHDSDNKDTPEEAIEEEKEEYDKKTNTKTHSVKNLLYKNSVFVYMILGWLGFISLALTWISRIVIKSSDPTNKSKQVIDILPNKYFKTIFSIAAFASVIIGLIAMTFYFISYTPFTLTIILDIVNFLVIAGGMAVIFEATKKSNAALLGGAFGLLFGGLIRGWSGALIAMLIGGIIGYVLGIGGGEQKVGPRKAFIKAVLAYIPCLFISLIDYVKNEFNMTTRKIWLLILFEILIIGLRVLLPIMYSKFTRLVTPKGNILVKDAVYLNNPTSLGMFLSEEQLKDSKFHERHIINYNYALSFWLWINPQPGSTSPAYNRPTSLLNFGDILKIKFNKNKIEIYAATSKKNIRPEQLIKVYELKKIEYQRWNNFVINYSGGTLDIFINNVLVSSTPNITPITQFEKATAGSVDGIYGGIKNIIYYENTLSRRQIAIVSKE